MSSADAIDALPNSMTPTVVSVVIPTHNRLRSLRNVLEALGRQSMTPDRFEVVVVCDGCTDGTAAMCAELGAPYPLRVFEQASQQGPAAARNRGVFEARSELILFLDDDVVPDGSLIEDHVEAHSGDDHAVVIGPLVAPPGFSANPWTRWEATMLERQYREIEAGRWRPGPRQFYTGNASVRREHLLDAGGFNPRFRRAEDIELAYRLFTNDLRFHFRPRAKGWHFAKRSLRSWLGIADAYGVADFEIGLNKPWTRSMAAFEFHQRKKPLRLVARACVGRPILLHTSVAAALVAAQMADLAGVRRISDAAYSAVFNLRYWHSLSTRMGGRAAFWAWIDSKVQARVVA